MNRAGRRQPEWLSGRLRPDAAVLYCDFDHTLHRTDAYRTASGVVPGSPTTPFFEYAGLLERLLLPYPEVVIVLSTSWVEELGVDEARNRLPIASLRARVVGATYDPNDTVAANWSAMTRGGQILRHVRLIGLKRWLAIDDGRAGFSGYESHLVHCQMGVVLGDKDVQKLLADRLEWMFGPSDLISPSADSTTQRPTG